MVCAWGYHAQQCAISKWQGTRRRRQVRSAVAARGALHGSFILQLQLDCQCRQLSAMESSKWQCH